MSTKDAKKAYAVAMKNYCSLEDETEPKDAVRHLNELRDHWLSLKETAC